MTNQEKEIQETLDHLSLLAPGAQDAPAPAKESFARLQAKLKPQDEFQSPGWIRRLEMLLKRRSIAVATSFVLIITVLFSFPSVQAAAGDFLGLFRVQKFAPLSISPEQLALLEQLADEGLSPGEFHIRREPGATSAVDSLAEAGRNTGLKPRTLSGLGEPEEIVVIEGGDGYLIIDVAASRAIVEAVGADPNLLADSLDGQRVDVVVFPGIEQNWEEYTFIQAESPLVEYPADVDPTVLGEAFLQVLGTEPEEARRIAQSIDWASTLLLPLPSQAVTFEEIAVDGVAGVALRPLNGVDEAALLWQKAGHVYVLFGPGTIEDLLMMADSIQ